MRAFFTLVVIALVLTAVASIVGNVLVKFACLCIAAGIMFFALLVFLLMTRDPDSLLPPRRRHRAF